MRSDWISPWWQAVTLPLVWDVCGVRVPSLTVWHYLALENTGNAYLDGGREPDHDDAAALLLFASRDMAGGRRLLHMDNHRARQMKRMHARLRKLEWAAIDAACGEYVATCTRHGTRMRPAGPAGSPAGTPEPWAIVAALCAMGHSWDAVWNFAYAPARALLDARDEGLGNATMTPGYYGEEMIDNWDEWKAKTGTRELLIH